MVTLARLIKSTHSYTLSGVSNEPFSPPSEEYPELTKVFKDNGGFWKIQFQQQ